MARVVKKCKWCIWPRKGLRLWLVRVGLLVWGGERPAELIPNLITELLSTHKRCTTQAVENSDVSSATKIQRKTAVNVHHTKMQFDYRVYSGVASWAVVVVVLVHLRASSRRASGQTRRREKERCNRSVAWQMPQCHFWADPFFLQPPYRAVSLCRATCSLMKSQLSWCSGAKAHFLKIL